MQFNYEKPHLFRVVFFRFFISFFCLVEKAYQNLTSDKKPNKKRLLTREWLLAIVVLQLLLNIFNPNTTAIAISTEEGDSEILIHETQFGFESGFLKEQIQSFLDKQPGQLKAYKVSFSDSNQSVAQTLQDISLQYRINPKVLLTLLEVQTGLITEQFPTQAMLEKPLASDTTSGFANQLTAIALELGILGGDYPTKRELKFKDNLTILASSKLNQATYALQAFLAQTSTKQNYTQKLHTSPKSFLVVYSNWFGNPTVSRNLVKPNSTTNPAFPSLPWAYGNTGVITSRARRSNGDLHDGGGAIDFYSHSQEVTSIADGQIIANQSNGRNCDDQSGSLANYLLIKYTGAFDGWYGYYYHFAQGGVYRTSGNVQAGITVIGRQGYTGTTDPCNSSGIHLHIQFVRDGTSYYGNLFRLDLCQVGQVTLNGNNICGTTYPIRITLTNTGNGYAVGQASGYQSAFIEAYNRRGGVAALGRATGVVTFYGNSGVTWQPFENGAIFHHQGSGQAQDTRAYAITGNFYNYYNNLGGPPSWLGTITSDEFVEGNERKIHFAYGYLYEIGGVVNAGAWPTSGTGWRSEYYNNKHLVSGPTVVTYGGQLNFDYNWGLEKAYLPVFEDYWSARYTRSEPFIEGRYRFRGIADDGVRVWLDNDLIIDRWATPGEFSVERIVAKGNHNLKIEFHEESEAAHLLFEVTPLDMAEFITASPHFIFVPDGYAAFVIPGQQLQYSVTTKNTGTAIWTETSATEMPQYRLGSVENVSFFGFQRSSMQAGEQVQPGQNHEWSINLTIPANQPVGYNGVQIQMVNESVTWFGPRKSLHINVSPTLENDIAQGKTVATSSVYANLNNLYGGQDMVDSNPNSRWASGISDVDPTPSLTIQLGAVYNLERAKIYWARAFSKKYSVEYLANSGNWQTVFTTASGNGAMQELTFPPQALGSQIRITSQEHDLNHVSIWEVEVFGTLVSQLPPLVVTNPNDAGDVNLVGTLSWALNTGVSGQTIHFNLGGENTIQVRGILPPVKRGVAIQADCANRVIIDGSIAAPPSTGLVLNGSNKLEGLLIKGFSEKQLRLSEALGNIFRCVSISQT